VTEGWERRIKGERKDGRNIWMERRKRRKERERMMV